MATTVRASTSAVKQLPIEESRHIVAMKTGRIGYPDDHAIAVAECSLRIAVRLDLDADARHTIAVGALLHDVGKLHVDNRILSKPGPLTVAERRKVERHPVEGERIVRDAVAPPVRDVVLAHHERWDGAGYPRGLAGSDIPLAARVVAVADAFLAMCETRPYRTRRTQGEAVEEIEACAGSQFDPTCVKALVSLVATPAQSHVQH
jgi:HD-GYP domain-containing protein (c-di-GMP phosphodiesterase class II)